MGIRGLTGFIDRNHHLLQEYKLHDCNVIIDGNNLYHFLYHARHVRCIFGGDYDVYRRKLISTFESFKLCGITPYVVMDGAYTKDGRKLKTSLSRASARIRLVDAMVNVDRGQALPCLALETFMQVLIEMEIPHVVCQFEADNDIAVLANKMNCPVISNDSDFYIFDLKAGFLPLDYVDFNPLYIEKTESSDILTFLSCRKYSVDDFIHSFDGLSRSVLPVFASMLGNDYIKPGSFQALYRRFKVPKIVSKKYHLPPRLSKVISVLHWLHTSYSNDDSSLEEKLFLFVKSNQHDRVLKLFHGSVTGYKDVENFAGFDIQDFFQRRGSQDLRVRASPDFQSYDDRPFPSWFVKAAALGELSPFIVNAALLHRVIILCQVEDLKLPSSYNCSRQIRQVIYGIFLKGRKLQKESAASQETKCALQSGVATASDAANDKTADDSPVVPSLSSVSDCTAVTSDSEEGVEMGDSDHDEEIGEDEEDTIDEECCSEETMSEVSCRDEGAVTKHNSVEEYSRLNKGLQKSQILPVTEVGGLNIPDLYEIEFLGLQEKRNILCASMGVPRSSISQFQDHSQQFALGVIMWIQNADPNVSALHLDTVIVCAVVLKALAHLEKFKDSKSVTEKGSGASGDTADKASDNSPQASSSNLDLFLLPSDDSLPCDVSAIQHVQKSTVKYLKQAPSFNNRKRFEPDIVHAFAQFQACLVDSLNLVKLLRFPIPSLQPAMLINGTFLYNLYSELLTRPRTDLFLASLLGKDSWLHREYQKMRDCFMSLVGDSNFASLASSAKHHNKKGRKRKVNGDKGTKNKNGPDKPKEEDESTENQGVYGFDIENKFSMLMVET